MFTPSDGIRIVNMNKGFNRFGLNLGSQILDDTNQVFSPFSITLLLAMLLPGTKGETQQEIEAILQLDRSIPAMCDLLEKNLDYLTNRGEVIKLGNGLFLPDENEIKRSYQEILKRSFKAISQTIDVSDPAKAAKQINQWVSDSTNGMIPILIDPSHIHPSTLLILINTVYLLTTWRVPFKPEDTTIEPFYLKPHIDDQSINISMMNATLHCDAFRDNNHTYTSVRIPMSRNLSFQVVLPEPGKYDEVCNNLPTALGSDEQNYASKIELSLPKFNIESSFGLNDTLKALGVKAAFQIRDDFDGITASSPLGISRIIQKAKVIIDEKGVEAAAATSMFMITGTMPRKPPPKPVPFIVNRPFVFLIWDNTTGALLFVGCVYETRVTQFL